MKDTKKDCRDDEKGMDRMRETEKELNESFDEFLKELSDRDQPSCNIDDKEDCDSCGS